MSFSEKTTINKSQNIRTENISINFDNTIYLDKNNDSIVFSKIKRKKFIFLPEEVDEIEKIRIEKKWHNKALSLQFSTNHDYRKLLSYFQEKFGVPNLYRSSSKLDSLDLLGKYRWNHINVFDMQNLEITLILWDFDGSFSLEFTVLSEKFEDIKYENRIIDFFKKTCQDYLFNQKKINKSQTNSKHQERYFGFKDFFYFNRDSLIHKFEQFLSITDEKVSINVSINKNGEIAETNITENKKIKPFIESFLHKIDFPIIMYSKSRDIIRYHLHIDFWLSEETFLNRAIVIVKSGVKKHLPIGYTDGVYNITSGDFFNIGKVIYIIRNPYGKSTYFCEIINGEYKELFHATNIENEWYPDMYNEDLNNDGKNEVIFQTIPNSNGNMWKEVFAYDKVLDNIYYAGKFNTQETIDKTKNEIHVEFAGSWYTPQSRKVYGWKNGKLISKKFIELTLEDTDSWGIGSPYIMEYYENPFFDKGIDTLILKKIDWNSSKYNNLWNNFYK